MIALQARWVGRHSTQSWWYVRPASHHPRLPYHTIPHHTCTVHRPVRLTLVQGVVPDHGVPGHACATLAASQGRPCGNWSSDGRFVSIASCTGRRTIVFGVVGWRLRCSRAVSLAPAVAPTSIEQLSSPLHHLLLYARYIDNIATHPLH